MVGLFLYVGCKEEDLNVAGFSNLFFYMLFLCMEKMYLLVFYISFIHTHLHGWLVKDSQNFVLLCLKAILSSCLNVNYFLVVTGSLAFDIWISKQPQKLEYKLILLITEATHIGKERSIQPWHNIHTVVTAILRISLHLNDPSFITVPMWISQNSLSKDFILFVGGLEIVDALQTWQFICSSHVIVAYWTVWQKGTSKEKWPKFKVY